MADKKTKTVNMVARFSPELAERLDIASQAQRESKNTLIARFVDSGLSALGYTAEHAAQVSRGMKELLVPPKPKKGKQ